MEIVLNSQKLRRVLIWVPAFLIFCGFCVEVLFALGFEVPFLLVPFLSLSYEKNLPTWFSSCLLYSCSVLLALIAVGSVRHEASWTQHWWGLAIAFLYISLDETATLHEHASGWFHFGGVLYFGWVIPAGIIVAFFALSYARFLGHLPLRTRVQFILAGAIYVGGALGVELPLAYWTEKHGDDNFVYAMIDLIEESMEMIGVSLFTLALLEYLAEPVGAFRVAVRRDY